MKKYRLFAMLLVFFIGLSSTAQQSSKDKTIGPFAFAEKINSTFAAQIIDVRTPEEFKSGHIANAKNNNWLGTSFESEAAKLDKTKPIYVYCKSGNRSSKAVKKLEEMGFETIYELEGGYVQWELAATYKPTTTTIGMSAQEYDHLLESEKAVLIYFAGTCKECPQMQPVITKIGKQLAEKLEIIPLDAEKNKTIALELDINNLPVLLLYKNKNIHWRHVGIISEGDLLKQLQ
jgi:rhodanese-related sulfurtransferase